MDYIVIPSLHLPHIKNIRVVFTTQNQFPVVLRQHTEWTHLQMTVETWTSVVRGRTDIALISPRCSSELPDNVTCRSRAVPVRPWCSETLVLGSSKKTDVCVHVAKMRGQGRTLPE